MYLSLGFKDATNGCNASGFICQSNSFMQLGEYCQTRNKRFEYQSFSAILSDLSDAGAATVFSIAASGGNYLVPVAKMSSRDADKDCHDIDTLLVWMPRGLLRTVIRYLEDFERVVKSSYDYLQEGEEVSHMVNEIGLLRGQFIQSEKKRKQLYAAMTWNQPVQTDENRKLVSEHFSGNSKCTFILLLDWLSNLKESWDSCCPQWKTWQEALDGEWGVDAHTDSPLKNFERIVKHMQTRESEEKAMRS